MNQPHKEGLHLDVPIVEYHRSPGISKSGLDAIHKSPAHYHALYLNPNRPPRNEKAGQLEGTLAHCAILEPDEWANRYRVGPDVSRATREWKSFAEQLPRGVVGIKPDQQTTAMLQAQSVGRMSEVARLLAVGQPEVSAYCLDEETGVLCRVRPDWVHPVGDDAVILVDVKTFSDASGKEFRRQLARKRYHVQAALYTDVFAAASGKTVLGFVFVTVEDEWPFLAAASTLNDRAMEQGRLEYRADLDLYRECVDRQRWPGYSTDIEVLSLPEWALWEQ